MKQDALSVTNTHKGFLKGFTLIELLIVIAIIGILATLVTINVLSVRMRGRDAQRKADLRQMQSALELYRADQGSYPTTAQLPACGAQFVGPAPANTIYMQKMPCDPFNAAPYVYTYSSAGSTYDLAACIENTNDQQKDASNNHDSLGNAGPSACAGGSANWSYTVSNP